MDRREKAANLIRKLGAEFLERERVDNSLITVTRADVSPDFRKATLFITVLPENEEETVLRLARQKRSEMRDIIKERLDTKIVPFLDVVIDLGEKNRQKIDELLRE